MYRMRKLFPLTFLVRHSDGYNAGIFKQLWELGKPVGIGFVVPDRQAPLAGAIHSLESILGLLKSLKICALNCVEELGKQCKSRLC